MKQVCQSFRVILIAKHNSNGGFHRIFFRDLEL